MLFARAASTPSPATGWRAVARWLWEEERIGLPICLLVALFTKVTYGESYAYNLLYSLLIGQTIQFSIEAGRFGAAAWQARRRGEPFDRLHAWPGWAFMGPWIVACAAGGYAAGMFMGDWLLGLKNAASIAHGSWRGLLPIGMITLGVSLAASWFFYSRGQLAQAQAQAEAAQRVAAENQLRLLQSQLEPHMLFNTLATLRVLIGLDAGRAQAMLDQLVGFLRSTLQASRQREHPLRDEFARLADYLALMQLRMGPRLQFTLELPAALEALPVPPLLLQPLVENAIKHGLEPKREGGRLVVTARRGPPPAALLEIDVRDTGLGLRGGSGAGAAGPAAGTSFGLDQVRARLGTVYGPGAQLLIEAADDADGGTWARLRLPLPVTGPGTVPMAVTASPPPPPPPGSAP